MGGCFALPHRPLRVTESGSPHQYRHLSEVGHEVPAPRNDAYRRWAAASPSRTGRFASPSRARPISTATFPKSVMRFPRLATTHTVDGRLLRPPAPAGS